MKNSSTVQGQTIPGSYTLDLLLSIGIQILEIPICQIVSSLEHLGTVPGVQVTYR